MAEITANHKNSIRSSLLVTERHLQDIKSRLKGSKVTETIMYRDIDDLGLKTKSVMLKTVNAMLKEIMQTRDEFGLEVVEEGLERHVSASMTEIWVMLEELTPGNLKAYGKVSEAEKAVIGPKVYRLLRQFDELEAALDNKG